MFNISKRFWCKATTTERMTVVHELQCDNLQTVTRVPRFEFPLRNVQVLIEVIGFQGILETTLQLKGRLQHRIVSR